MQIDVSWLPAFHGSAEVGRTSAEIQIRFGELNATRFEDAWSQSVQQRARVSAYPIALWLASSWWRLRWEPLPSRVHLADDGTADVGWRMSHELPAAGYGFVWPHLEFASDGESIRVKCHRSPPLSTEPVHFLSDFETFVHGTEFEEKIDAFMDLVLRRLDDVGETDLHRIWREVVAERADSEQAAARRLEARLGYEPDEAPGTLLEQFMLLGSEAGPDAADEIAPVCAGVDPSGTLDRVKELASLPGMPGRISIPSDVCALEGWAPPWERGRRLANALRESLVLGNEPLDDDELAGLLNIQGRHLSSNGSPHAPMGLAIREGAHSQLKLLFRKRNRSARRFEAARFVADHLCAGQGDHWLPVTDAATARQKVQRAFAAEFLCPIDSLREYLGNDLLPEAFEDAAEHFGISEMAVKSHLANNDLIPRSLVYSTELT